MGFVSKFVDNVTGGNSASNAAKNAGKIDAQAATDAARFSEDAEWQARNAEVGGEVQARDYLMQQNEMDRQGSQGAKSRLMGMYGIGDNAGFQDTLINQAKESPLYASIMGTAEYGNDAIMANAAATGGLRSGNVQSNMYNFNQRLGERALNESYQEQLSGLQDVAGWQTNEDNISQAMLRPGETTAGSLRDIGRYRAQGAIDTAGALSGSKIAGANAIQEGRGGVIDAVAEWSDRRLKDDIKLVGEIDGINVYSWQWNDAAEDLGLSGSDVGVIADEIELTRPDLVNERMGYKTVNYEGLGI